MEKVIVVNEKSFTINEMISLAIIEKALGGSFTIIKSNDPNIIDSADIVLSTGGIYNHKTMRYDYHQELGLSRRKSNKIYRSTCGMIWKHYGKMYLRKCGIPKENINEIWEKIDDFIITPIDVKSWNIQWANTGLKIDYDIPHGSFHFRFLELAVKKYETIESYFNITVKRQISIVNYALLGEIMYFKENIKDILYVKEMMEKQKDSLILLIGEIDLYSYLMVSDLINDSNFKRLVYSEYGHYKVKVLKNSPSIPTKWIYQTQKYLKKETGVESIIYCYSDHITVGDLNDAIKLAELSLK